MSDSLLSRETNGWKLVSSWPALFALYDRDGEVEADLSSELQGIVNTLTRGHSPGDADAPKLERALVLTALMSMEGEGAKGSPFDPVARTAANDLADTLGAAVLQIISAKERHTAELRASECLSLCKRAIDGIARMKFPNKARGSGENICKAVRAIYAAKHLCQLTRTLPSKADVVMMLDPERTAFGRTKDWWGKWRIHLIKAGLEGLPGTLPPRD